MNKDIADEIPLTQIAPDAAALIAAFRNGGALSFQDFPLSVSRTNYLASCRANGLAKEEVAEVRDIDIPVQLGQATIRIYRGMHTPAAQPAPMIFFIHGGGWVIGDLESHDAVCRYLANKVAARVIAVDYRRSPEHRFPVPLNDCRDALQYVHAHRDALGVDMSRAVVFGDSAGGNMAAVLANRLDHRPQDFRFAGQVLIYPVTDLTAGHDSYKRITRGFPLTSNAMYWFRDQYLHQFDPSGLNDDRLSPFFFVHREAPSATFIATVGLDPLADEGIAYAGKLARAGAHVTHIHLPRHAHGLLTSAGKIPTGSDLLSKATDFIRSILG